MQLRVLNRKNKEIESRIGKDAVNRGTTWYEKDDYLKKYEDYMENGKIISVKFETCGRDGTFVGADKDGVILVMSSNVTIEHLPYFKPHMAGKFVGYSYDVRVVRVEREQKRVYLESAKVSRIQSTEGQIVNELKRALESGEKPLVWGKITAVNEKTAHISILGERVHGVVDVRFWQNSYVRKLTNVCKEGEYYNFHVTRVIDNQGKAPVFFLNRKELADDPWELIPMDLINVGAQIFVTCEENPKDGRTWWGTSRITPGIEIMGLYQRNENKPTGERLDVIPGITYRCTIIQLKTKEEDFKGNGVFVVMPVSVCDDDMERYKKYLAQKELRILAAGEKI